MVVFGKSIQIRKVNSNVYQLERSFIEDIVSNSSINGNIKRLKLVPKQSTSGNTVRKSASKYNSC